METVEWKKRIANGECPLCGGKVEKSLSTVGDSKLDYRLCPNCRFCFPYYFTFFEEKPDILTEDEWNFQAIVDQHLEKLEKTAQAGQEALAQSACIMFKG